MSAHRSEIKRARGLDQQGPELCTHTYDMLQMRAELIGTWLDLACLESAHCCSDLLTSMHICKDQCCSEDQCCGQKEGRRTYHKLISERLRVLLLPEVGHSRPHLDSDLNLSLVEGLACLQDEWHPSPPANGTRSDDGSSYWLLNSNYTC